MKIFVDAMGGDRAPRSVLAGLQLFRNELKADIVLLGNETDLRPLVKKLRYIKPSILHCSETIDMGESPMQSVRTKRDSSIVRGLELTAATPNSAFFSAGHSGAVFAAALLKMGRLDGVERPAIATVLPTSGGHCIFLDAGANVDCRPNHLVDFARMGSLYAKITLKHENPTVGLLSNGEEDSKGTDLTRNAHLLLEKRVDLRYLGYLEGKELFHGKASVVITDGFTGNVVLKSVEGLGKLIASLLRSEFKQNLLTKIGALFSYPALTRIRRKLDYAEVGGAPLLGVNGLCFIGHGRSNARAIKNGILRTQEALQSDLLESLRKAFHGSTT